MLRNAIALPRSSDLPTPRQSLCRVRAVAQPGALRLPPTGAFLDRLTHHTHILEMNGDSHHLKQSIGTADRLVGHFYIHNGESSGFVCERALTCAATGKSSRVPGAPTTRLEPMAGSAFR